MENMNNQRKKVLTGFKTDIAKDSDRELYVTEKPVIIESFEWGSVKETGLAPFLYSYDDDMSSNYNGNLFVCNRAYARGFASPENIIEDGSSYFEPKIYNREAGVYTFKLSQQIYMPNGARLFYRNFTNDLLESTWHLVVRELS